MAITIDQGPAASSWVYARNKVVFVASSSNVGNTGFRFVFEVEIAGVTTSYQVPPNPANKGVIELGEHLRAYLGPRLEPADASQLSIHQLGQNTATLHLNELASNNATKTVQLVSVTIKEGWIISGVFTPTAVGQATRAFIVQNGGLRSWWHGFNVEAEVNPIGNAMTDRTTTTGVFEFPMDEAYGFPTGSGVKIPVGENDLYTLHFNTDDSTYTTLPGGNYKIRGVIYASDGTPTTKEITITSAAGQITHFGCGPLNLALSSIGTGFFNPADFPGYRCYTIGLLDSADNQLSTTYIFFPKEYHCKLRGFGSDPTTVQVSWVNDKGEWDYFRFDYKAEVTQKVERKRMRQVVGDYAASTFSIANIARGIAETAIHAERTITLTSKPLDEGEFRLMSSLLRSTEVYVLTDFTDVPSLSNIIPIVIETADNIEYRPLDSKLRTFTLTAKEAHPVIS